MTQRRILLVEDNPADIRITQEVLRESQLQVAMDVVRDGEQAMAFLRGMPPYTDAPRPDLILLDLNLPRKDGREVLTELKQDPELRSIPVVMLTTSKADRDISDCYARQANSYVAKPVNFDDFMHVFVALENYWLNVASLPSRASA